jgi:methyl coenzyme M reductase beta subunit
MPRARRILAAQFVAAGASRAVKGLSGAILNYYTTADHKIRPEILPTLA